jgi:hypothetical protein
MGNLILYAMVWLYGIVTLRSIISLFLASTSFFNVSTSAFCAGTAFSPSALPASSLFAVGLDSAESEYQRAGGRVLSGGAAERDGWYVNGRSNVETDRRGDVMGARVLSLDARTMVRDNMVGELGIGRDAEGMRLDFTP